MESILSIKQCDYCDVDSYEREYEGYCITTDKQQIKLLIASGTSCCESWGYFMSHDNLDEFIGSKLLNVKIVDEALNVKTMEDLQGEDTAIMFVNIETSAGLLQFVAHNSHNGYYSHEARVISTQLNHSERL